MSDWTHIRISLKQYCKQTRDYKDGIDEFWDRVLLVSSSNVICKSLIQYNCLSPLVPSLSVNALTCTLILSQGKITLGLSRACFSPFFLSFKITEQNF